MAPLYARYRPSADASEDRKPGAEDTSPAEPTANVASKKRKRKDIAEPTAVKAIRESRSKQRLHDGDCLPDVVPGTDHITSADGHVEHDKHQSVMSKYQQASTRSTGRVVDEATPADERELHGQ